MSEDLALEKAVDIIKKWEGFRAEPYDDSVGVETVGYGFTPHLQNWERIRSAVPLSEPEADEFLREVVSTEYLPPIREMSGLTAPHKLAAYTSWAYNVGVPAARDSTLMAFLRSGKEEQAEQELLRWIYAGGKVLEGLVARRKAEKRLAEAGEDLPPEAFEIRKLQARKVDPVTDSAAEDWERHIESLISGPLDT